MTGDYKSRFMPGILSLMFTLLLLSGCIAENTDDCSLGTPLKVSLPAGVPSETVKDMTLYVFDDQDMLLDMQPMNLEESFMLDYPDIPAFHCVVLCNVRDSTLLVTPLKKGEPCSDGSVSLKPFVPTKAEEKNLFTSPEDWLYGEITIENKRDVNHPAEQHLEVSRGGASMIITLRGLQRLTGTEDTDYSLIVGETCSRMDFYGKYGGPPASYSPPVNLADNRDFLVSLFQLFPTAENKGLTIDIYHHNVLLKSITADGSGKPIIPVRGKTMNLLLDFEGVIDVEIQVTGWGEAHIWKEWS